MTLYCYKCPECGNAFAIPRRGVPLACGPCLQGGRMVMVNRDYRAEGVGVQTVELRRERERGGAGAVRDLFLPTAKELAGPGDPDGHKAIRKWNEEHDPKPGNTRPLRPESPRTVY